MMQISRPSAKKAKVIREPGRSGATSPLATTPSSTSTKPLPSVRNVRAACAGSGPPQEISQASREIRFKSCASKSTASNHCGWYWRPSRAHRRPSPSIAGTSGSILNSGRIVANTAR